MRSSRCSPPRTGSTVGSSDADKDPQEHSDASAPQDRDENLLAPNKPDSLFSSVVTKNLEPSLGAVIASFEFVSFDGAKYCKIFVKEEVGADELTVEYYNKLETLLEKQQLSAEFSKKLQHSKAKLEPKQKSQVISLRLVRSLKWHKQQRWPEVREESLNFEQAYHEEVFSQSLLF